MASAPYTLLFWISRSICPLCPTAPHLKANKDYNNEFSEDGKILKVGRSPEVSWRLPHLSPLTAFFCRGKNILFQISGGHMPHLFWNSWCIRTLFSTAPHASEFLDFFLILYEGIAKKYIAIYKKGFSSSVTVSEKNHLYEIRNSLILIYVIFYVAYPLNNTIIDKQSSINQILWYLK